MKTRIQYIRNRALICKILLTCLFWPASAVILRGQIKPNSPASVLDQKAKPGQDISIRVSVDEVRIDAVVLDWRGRQITNLTADDFEIYQDGKRQKIISCTYVNDYVSQPSRSTLLISTPPSKKDEVRRTILFLVDDLSMSFVNLNYTRMGLNNFVEKQMQPGDLVGILRTSNGFGPLFSSDKRQLLLAIEKIQWGAPQATASCGTGG